jgi:SRSO17 transposase
LEVIDQALAWELPVLPVVADSFYGNDFAFRQALRDRHLPYAVQVEPSTVVWTTDPNLPLPPPKKHGWGDRGVILRGRRCREQKAWRRWPTSCPRRLGAP